MKKKHPNEFVIFDQFLLEDCKNKGKTTLAKDSGTVNIDCICYRHGPFYQLKQKIRKEAIELTKYHLRQNNQKAYEVKDEDLEKLIKKKESRLRQKYWKMILRFGVIHGLGLSWLGI